MRTKYKPWAAPYIAEHPEYQILEEDYSSIKDCYLEIGCGKGQFLCDMAKKYPDFNFIGVEMNVTCAGITLKKIVEQEIPNAKLIRLDACKLLYLIHQEQIEGIFLNFSDPWPKKRHHKRRLTSSSFLEEYYRVLKPTGKLIFKTDNRDLFDFTLEMVASSKFNIEEMSYDYKENVEFDAVSEYEQNFRDKGQPIFRVVLGKSI